MTVATMPLPPAPTPTDEPVSPEDLLKMGQNGLFELVDGELVEKPMGALAAEATIIISSRLYPFVSAARLGRLYSEASFRCFPAKPNQVRRPDIAFVSAARVAQVPNEGHVPVRPDLAIEVVSPGDLQYDLDGKLLDYQSVALPLVWVVNPAFRIVRVFRGDGSIRQLAEGDMLDGEDVLPGFSAVVRDLFPATPA